ncbi:MAG: Clp protease N-terminal domain-containing protein [Actinomycetota bacterium]
MFERFTDRARRVVVLAQEEARMLNHDYIGTEHILLGLIHEAEGVAATALNSMGISLAEIRNEVESMVGRGKAAPTGHIPFTPRAKKVLELSLREALQLGHNYIGTEHILLGLIREGEGVAAQVLQKLGADLEEVRHKVVALLGEKGIEPSAGKRYLGRFTEETHRVLGLAGESARDLDHQAIEPADLLLALIAADDAQVNELLASWGIELAAVRRRIEELAAEEEGPADAPDQKE